MTSFMLATNCPDELCCALCLDSWKNPVELQPCGHIFCQECIGAPRVCPVCRAPVNCTKQPHRSLVNLAQNLPVRCSSCGWTGRREGSDSHTCPTASWSGSTEAPSTTNAQSTCQGSRQQSVADTPWLRYGLTQEEYDSIVALFVFFDSDESGHLCREEMGRLARWLNFARTDDDIDRMFREMDEDGTGTLCLEEFLSWLSKNRPDPSVLYGMSQQQYNCVMMQFRLYDRDRDGFLDADDFSKLAVRIGDVPDIESGMQLFRSITTGHCEKIGLHQFLLYCVGRMFR